MHRVGDETLADKLKEENRARGELTEQMIAAGASVLYGFDTTFEDENSWAARVYLAMDALRSAVAR